MDSRHFLWMMALLVVATLVALLMAGCAPGHFGQGLDLSQRGFHQEAVDQFYAEIREKPDSAAAWRELGISFFHLGRHDRAEEALQQAVRIRPDARAHLYLGLIFEQAGDFDRALSTYRTAVQMEPDGKTEELLRAHIESLLQQRIKQEIDAALAREEQLDAASIPANTIAVVEFDRKDLPPELAPLSKGLAEFTALDLAKVRSLDVVERAKIQVLLAELALGGGDLADPGARLRVGRLVGTRNLVTGSLQVDGRGDLEIYGAVGNTVDASVALADRAAGPLDKFFSLQKDMVFGVIDALGLKLSAAERDSIEAVPTESFLAFLAYCRGLEAEEAGNIALAAAHYKQAAAADKGFARARNRSMAARGALQLGSASGGDSFENAVTGSLLDAYQQQLYLIMLAEDSQFLPSDVPEVSLDNENPVIPNTTPVAGVPIVVRGRFDEGR